VADAEKKSTEALTPLANAAERIRGSAQWLLGAFAAVGALLAAGLQIADIGSLNADDWARVVAALAGIAIAVFGVVAAVSAAASVSTRSDVSLHWLTEHPNSEASKIVEADSALRQGLTVAQLRARLDQTATAAGNLFEEIVELGDPGNDATKQAKSAELLASYKEVTAELDRFQRIRANVLDVASFYRVKEAFDKAKRWMIGGAIAAAVGITAFAWGANAPESESLNGGDVLPKTPSEVTVILNERGIKDFGAQIRKNDKCDLSNLAAIAFDVTYTVYDVVTVGTDNCNVHRMRVGTSRGDVIPRVEDEADEESGAATSGSG
jgi:hypothetical protein